MRNNPAAREMATSPRRLAVVKLEVQLVAGCLCSSHELRRAKPRSKKSLRDRPDTSWRQLRLLTWEHQLCE